MEKVTLFKIDRPDIKVTMEVYFNEKGQLYFNGYDIGKTVEEAWGDSDYEYTYTIEPAEFYKLYQVFKLKEGDKAGILQAIKNKFSCNEAYTLLGDFMDEHDIKYDSFSWT